MTAGPAVMRSAGETLSAIEMTPKGYDALMEFCEAQLCPGANQPLSFKR